MEQSSAAYGTLGALPGQLSALSGWAPTHQNARSSALAATALAATATFALPRHGLLGGALLLRSLRRCSVLSSGASTGVMAGASAGPALGGPAASLMAAAPACLAGNPAAGGCPLWNQLRRQLQHHQHHQQRAGQPLSSLFRRAFCSSSCSMAVAAGDAAAAAVATARFAGGAGGGLLGRRGAGTAGGLPRTLNVRRMATQASGGASAGGGGGGGSVAAGAAAPSRGPLSRFRGRLGDALRLQLAAAWQAYGTAAYAGAALVAVFVLWRLMRSTTNLFIAVNDKMAEYGIMALSASLVLLAVLYLRWRTAVNPAAVYRQAMVQLNTSPGVLEVMGAPLVGSPVRAYVVTGGGMYLSKKFRIKLRSRRIQMMFPLSGPERKGLVSLEAKRKQGRYVWKLLAVDLGPELQQALPPGGSTGLSAAPPPRRPPPGSDAPSPLLPPEQQRVYAVGDSAAYQRGGVLGELRAPFLKALSNSRSYEVEDELDDELDDLDLPKSDGGVAKTVGAAVRNALASATAAFTKPSPPPPPPSSGGAAAAGDAAAAAEAPAVAASKEAQGGGGQGQPSAGGGLGSETKAAAGSSGSWWGRMRAVVSGTEASSGPAGK